MQYLGIAGAVGQSIYRAYSCYQALTWQPNSSLREATRLSKESHEMAIRSGLREDIQIVFANLHGEPARAIGNKSYQYLLVDPDYVSTASNDSMNNFMNVTVRHEYSHLLHDDLIKSKFVPALASVATTIAGVVFLSPLSTFALTTLTGFAAQALYSRYAEGRADDEAFQQSALIELESFRELLELSKANNIKLHNESFVGRLCFSAEGDDRRQIFSHPSLSGRIKFLSSAIETRK